MESQSLSGQNQSGQSQCGQSGQSQFDQTAQTEQRLEQAVFAGGCFWGLEHAFSRVPGVVKAESGYTGGDLENPSYEDVCAGGSGHAEAVRLFFDPCKVSYVQLARLFFELHDPTQLNRQGPDRGEQYRSAVFYADEGQKQVAQELAAALKELGYPVVTQLCPLGPFYLAEDYHQGYIRKNPGRSYLCHIPVRRFEIPRQP